MKKIAKTLSSLLSVTACLRLQTIYISPISKMYSFFFHDPAKCYCITASVPEPGPLYPKQTQMETRLLVYFLTFGSHFSDDLCFKPQVICPSSPFLSSLSPNPCTNPGKTGIMEPKTFLLKRRTEVMS
jgi:hypothetical protein